jgi:hypothetical protein
MTNQRESDAPATSPEVEKAAEGATKRQPSARFDGYDSFDSLYVVSRLTLNGSDADRRRAAVDLSTAVYELIAKRLKWHPVLTVFSEENGDIKSEAVWKLPELLEGESYLNGMSVISTWDEYAVLADLIREWDMNLVRSPSFCPVRIEAQRRDRHLGEAPTVDPELGDEAPGLLEKRIQFKEDLVVATRENDETLIRYIPVAAYKKNDVTNRFRFVETLAKNGVTMAEVTKDDAPTAGSRHPFTFINLRGLREKTEWS